MTSIPISGTSGKGGGKKGGGDEVGVGRVRGRQRHGGRRRRSETDDEVSSDEGGGGERERGERGEREEEEEGDSDGEYYDEGDEESYDEDERDSSSSCSYESDDGDEGDGDYDDHYDERGERRRPESAHHATKTGGGRGAKGGGPPARSVRSVGVESAYTAQSVASRTSRASRASRASSRRSQRSAARSSRGRFVVPKMSFGRGRSYSESEYGGEGSEYEQSEYTDTSETTIFLLKRHVCQGLALQTMLVVGFVLILVSCLVVAVLISYGVFAGVGGGGEVVGGGGDAGGTTSGTGVVVPMPPQDLGILCSAGVVQLDEGRGQCEEACRAATCCFVTVEDDGANDADNNATSSSCYEANSQVCDLYGTCASVVDYLDGGGGGFADLPFKESVDEEGPPASGPGEDFYREEPEPPPPPPQSSSPPPPNNDFDLNDGPEVVVGRPPPARPVPPALAAPAQDEGELELPTDDPSGQPSGHPSAVPSSNAAPTGNGTTAEDEDDPGGQRDTGGGDYNAIRVRMRYIGLGWVGFAVSPHNDDDPSSTNATKPSMVGSQAVIGLPPSGPGRLRGGGGGAPRAGVGGGDDIHNVFKYDLNERSPEGVVMMDMSHQRSLVNATVVQDDIVGETVLEFTKLLNETSDGGEGELDIRPTGDGTFLWAVGVGNALGPHVERGHFVLNLSKCRRPQSCYSTDPEYDEEIELSSERLTLHYKLITV